MPVKNTSTGAMQDFLIVDNPRVIRLIFNKKHNMILKLLTEKELSISDIARTLNMNPGSVHYHLKELEKYALVKQVREEVKGGIVKKFYRAVAKRILLDTPNFNRMDQLEASENGDFIERLIESIEYMGYHLLPENKEDAVELLLRYDNRIKRLYEEIYSSRLEDFEGDGMIAGNANQMVMIIRAKEDPEFDRICHEFNKLFVKYE